MNRQARSTRPDAEPFRGPAALRAERQQEAILEATWCYYHEALNQNQIAERLGISRATVVNYLAEARRRGYVRITLKAEMFREHALARALVDRFGLRDAMVAPSGEMSKARVARMTADWLPSLLAPGDRLGVAWGETVYRVAEAAAYQNLPRLEIVQLVGSRPAALGFPAEVCSAMLARRFGAHCVNLHVPLLVSEAALADRLRTEPVIADQLQAVASCNKVLFACGTCAGDSHIVQAGVFSPSDLRGFVARGATGVICGRLIDAEGQPIESGIEDRMLGVALHQMKGKEMALLVGSGADRVAALRAAARGGFATHLATCATTARALLAA